jgi:hypothetical protein
VRERGTFGGAAVRHAYFLKGKESVVELVLDDNRRLERNGHIGKLKGSVRQQLEDKTVRQFLRNLHRKGPIGASGRLDSPRNIGVRIDVLEDNTCSEADLLFHVTA